jgi:hypothetical protein
MIDQYRIYAAYLISPLVGLVILFYIWLQPDKLCTTSTECFRIMPVSVILIVTYLLNAGMFMTRVTGKARELFGDSGLPFWRLAAVSIHRILFASLIMTSVVLFLRWPVVNGLLWDAALALLLPPVAIFALYSSWYLIVGRNNKQIRLDAQRERTLAA